MIQGLSKLTLSSSSRIPVSNHISGRNSALSVMEVPPVVPPVVSVPNSTQNPVLTPTPTMNESLTVNTESDSLFSILRRRIVESVKEEPSSGSSVSSGSMGLALRSLPLKKFHVMQLCFRYFPDHTPFINGSFLVTDKLKTRLKHLHKLIGFNSSTVPFYNPDIIEYSNLGLGLRSLVNENYDKLVVEALTFYKGKYGRVIILVSLGVCCTIWSMFVPGVGDVPPPAEHFPRFDTYQSFFNPETNMDQFKKACFIERTDISDVVLKTLEKEYPFNEMNIPATGNKKIAVGLALMIVVFMATGVSPVKQEI